MRSIIALLLLISLQQHLSAQQTIRRSGAWFGAGFGLGQISAVCSSCESRETGLATHGMLRGGVTLSRRLLIGLEYVRGQSQRNTDAITAIGITTYLYPFPEGNMFVKVGLGLSFYDTRTPHSPDVQGYGLGIISGLGYDLRATERISLTPTLTALYGRQSDIGTSGAQETHFAFSIGVTFH